jgi:5-bromo-4-chloroindolyl phosphate hydrolysis protein
MDFEEKMDAIRMNLELASHDIESLRASIEEQRESIRELRDASASQFESIQVLGKATEALLATAQRYDQRITGLERRA